MSSEPSPWAMAGAQVEVCGHLLGQDLLPLARAPAALRHAGPDMAAVRGQLQARRALEVVAAGGHHLLLVGPPGCGKTLLASRLPGLMPQAREDEALVSAAIASVGGGGLDPARWRDRPFRAPHHTASAVALVGGGAPPRPGEISLAHDGVLFLGELPEWDRRTLDVLRQPLESGVAIISRAARQAEFPARFQLVCAMNPCPCGWAGDASGRCRCPAEAMDRYRARVSGPLLDRIDLHVTLSRLPACAMRADAPCGEASASIRARVAAARDRQQARSGASNADLSQAETAVHCALAAPDRELLERAVESLQLSARAMHRILRVARPIADLDGATLIATRHLSEALSYREQ